MTELTLARLLEYPPDWLPYEIDQIEVLHVEHGKCGALFSRVVIPKDLAEAQEDLLAFGIAYGLGLDVFRNIVSSSTDSGISLEVIERAERLPTPIAMGVGAVLGIVSTPIGLFRTGREIGEIEAKAIENAVSWLHKSGFDPHAGADYFERGFGQISDVNTPKSFKLKVVSNVLKLAFKPLTVAMDTTRQGRKIFQNNEERAAFARETARKIAC